VTRAAWNRGDLSDNIGNHLYAEAIFQRQSGDVLQIIERVRVSATNVYERSSYRRVEIRSGKVRQVGRIHDTLKAARFESDRRARRVEREAVA